MGTIQKELRDLYEKSRDLRALVFEGIKKAGTFQVREALYQDRKTLNIIHYKLEALMLQYEGTIKRNPHLKEKDKILSDFAK